MAYTSVVRVRLHFVLEGWRASYSLHFGFRRPITYDDVERTTAWGAQLDIPNFYIGATIGSIRSSSSRFVKCRGTVIAGPELFTSLLLIDNAVQEGGDSELPVLSAGQAIQAELVTGKAGRGVNGRIYFPYWGNSAYDHGSTDHVSPDAASIVQGVCSSFGFYTPRAIDGEWCVRKRQVAGIPVSPLDSDPVQGVVIRAPTFRSQRLRVQPRRPFTLPI